MTKKSDGESRRGRLMPELDLPPLLIELLVDYIGPRRINRITVEARGELASLCTTFAINAGDVIRRSLTEVDGPDGTQEQE